jgi:hypothetical protein
MLTLTYGPPFCTDLVELKRDVREFVKRLRRMLGVRCAYVWVAELHADDVRFHAHVGLDRYVAKTTLDAAWGHGWVDIRRRRSSRNRTSTQATSAYLSKYVGKAYDAIPAGVHRYGVGEGFQPARARVVVRTHTYARQLLVEAEGGEPSYEFKSDDVEDWAGPSTRVLFWDK